MIHGTRSRSLNCAITLFVIDQISCAQKTTRGFVAQLAAGWSADGQKMINQRRNM